MKPSRVAGYCMTVSPSLGASNCFNCALAAARDAGLPIGKSPGLGPGPVALFAIALSFVFNALLSHRILGIVHTGCGLFFFRICLAAVRNLHRVSEPFWQFSALSIFFEFAD